MSVIVVEQMTHKLTLTWSKVLVDWTGGARHARIYRTAASKAIAHIENTTCRAVINTSLNLQGHNAMLDVGSSA